MFLKQGGGHRTFQLSGKTRVGTPHTTFVPRVGTPHITYNPRLGTPHATFVRRAGTTHSIFKQDVRGGHRTFNLMISSQMFLLGWGHRTNFRDNIGGGWVVGGQDA